MGLIRWAGAVRRWAPTAIMGCVLAAALMLRTYGLHWDRGLLFHPDERRILMTVSQLGLPSGAAEFLRASSPLNPGFFAYGSFPLYLLRAVSALPWLQDVPLYVLGRVLAAACDTLTVWATYSLGRKLWSRWTGILAAMLVAVAVLHIQLAHFFTVDVLLTLWVVVAVSRAVELGRSASTRDGWILAIVLGCALATKASALPLVAVGTVAWFLSAVPIAAQGDGQMERAWPTSWREWAAGLRTWVRAVWPRVRRGIGRMLAGAAVTFVVVQPYAIIDAYRFVVGVGTEIAMANRWVDFPYTRQYVGTLPYLYPLRQLMLFAVGVPLGIMGLGGLLWWGRQSLRAALQVLAENVARTSVQRDLLIWMAWPALYGLSQGAAAVKFIRYLLPLVPFLCLAGASWWTGFWARSAGSAWRRGALLVLLASVLAGTALYAAAFASIYDQTHPWLQASDWLCRHLDAGSTVLSEVWDDPLPVQGLPGESGCSKGLASRRLNLYELQGDAGLAALVEAISATDAIVLSSDRVYAPITRLARRYPLSSRYYQALFSGELGFELAFAPTVFPRVLGFVLADNPRAGLALPVPKPLAEQTESGVVISLGRADESFTVYDHPQPLVFVKVRAVASYRLEQLLQAAR